MLIILFCWAEWYNYYQHLYIYPPASCLSLCEMAYSRFHRIIWFLLLSSHMRDDLNSLAPIFTTSVFIYLTIIRVKRSIYVKSVFLCSKRKILTDLSDSLKDVKASFGVIIVQICQKILGSRPPRNQTLTLKNWRQRFCASLLSFALAELVLSYLAFFHRECVTLVCEIYELLKYIFQSKFCS